MGGKVSFFLQLSGFSLNRETMLFRDLFFFWDTWLQAEYFLFHPILKELWFLSCALYAYDGWYSAADSAVLVTVLLPWLILNTIPDFTSAFLLHSRGKEYSQYLHFCVLRPNKENFQLPFFFFFCLQPQVRVVKVKQYPCGSPWKGYCVHPSLLAALVSHGTHAWPLAGF